MGLRLEQEQKDLITNCSLVSNKLAEPEEVACSWRDFGVYVC